MSERTRKKFKVEVTLANGKVEKQEYSCAGKKGARAQAIALAGPGGRVNSVYKASSGSQRTAKKNSTKKRSSSWW